MKNKLFGGNQAHHTFPTVQKQMVKACSGITILIYLIIAALLVATVIIATVDCIEQIISAFNYSTPDSLVTILQSILFIIILATIVDMVRSYMKFGRVLLRPILVAGITTMVRRLLVNNQIAFLDILGIVLVILALTAAIIFISREDRKLEEFIIQNKLRKNEEGEPIEESE